MTILTGRAKQLGLLLKCARLLNDAHGCRRSLALSASAMKWVKNPVGPGVPVSWNFGHPDDPIRNEPDPAYAGSERFGDKLVPEFSYREYPREKRSFVDRAIHTFACTLFWYWLLYHLYYHSGHLFGHYYLPYTTEFTDEELGIPADGAEDPEYWGNHGKPVGTFR